MKEKEGKGKILGTLIKKTITLDTFFGLIRKNPGYFALWIILLMVSVFNHNQSESKIIKIIKLEKKVDVLKVEVNELQSINTHTISISEIQNNIKKHNLELKDPEFPPQKIKYYKE